MTLPQAEEPSSGLDWTTMQGASRATIRSVKTLLRWVAESQAYYQRSEGEEEERAEALPRAAYFTPEEARQVGRTVGTGRAWRIQLAALRRVHFARSGTYWSAEAAHAVAALPLAAQEERTALLARLDAQERELAALRSQLRSEGGGGGGGGARRERRQRSSPRSPSRLPDLPEGWSSFSTWVTRQALDYRSAQRLVTNGTLPVPRAGEWRAARGHTVQHAYDPDQRERAEEALRQLTAYSGGPVSPVDR